MSRIANSKNLNNHFQQQKAKQWHIDYLNRILSDIDPKYLDTFLKIKENIELTILNNPESENDVVSYLSSVSEKLQNINRKRWQLIRREVELVY